MKLWPILTQLLGVSPLFPFSAITICTTINNKPPIILGLGREFELKNQRQRYSKTNTFWQLMAIDEDQTRAHIREQKVEERTSQRRRTWRQRTGGHSFWTIRIRRGHSKNKTIRKKTRKVIYLFLTVAF